MESVSSNVSVNGTSVALRGPCVTLHRAVCAEAIRVVFALRFLSRHGVDHLAHELQSCQPSSSNGQFSSDAGESDGEAIALLVEKNATPSKRRRKADLSSSHHSGLPSPSDHEQQRWREEQQDKEVCREAEAVSFATPAAARHCLERAAQLSLFTAAHLLRCSTWTASLLVGWSASTEDEATGSPTPWPVSNEKRSNASPSDALLALSAQAHALELLRTEEPGWCATVLVRFTEWLLHRVAISPRQRTSLAHALSLIEYERMKSFPAVYGAALLANAMNSDEYRIESRELVSPKFADIAFPERKRGQSPSRGVVTVQDTLTLFFPWLRSKSTEAAHLSHATDTCCCCDHRWFLEDLARWCVDVATDRQATAWYRHRLLRDVVTRWRTRRGLRVMSYLSKATEQQQQQQQQQQPLVDGKAEAIVRQLFENNVDIANDSAALAEEEKEIPQRPQIAPKRHASECQTERVLRCSIDEQATAPVCEPVQHNAAPQASAHGEREAAFEGKLAPALRSASALSAASKIAEDISQTSKTVTTYEVSILDRVLNGRDAEPHRPSNFNGVYESGEINRSDTPAALPGPAAAVAATATASHRASKAHSPPSSTSIEVTPSRSSSSCAEFPISSTEKQVSSANRSKKRAAQFDEQDKDDWRTREEQLVAQCRAQHQLNALRTAFLLWRNRRLYESMAARYVQRQVTGRLVQRCWCVWQRRCAAAAVRRKEARDDALGALVTEQKAVQYFRRLLQVWRRAALARRFLVHHIGACTLQSWRCKAVLAQWQRTSQQQYMGALRAKRAVWQQWCQRRMGMKATQFRARYLLTHTLEGMQARCCERGRTRQAIDVHVRNLTARVWHAWVRRQARAVQLRTTAHSVNYEDRLRRRASRHWRTRTRDRERTARYKAAVDTFRLQHTLLLCLQLWAARFGIASRVRGFVTQRQRSSLLQPAFERWRVRAELCGVVRRGREELAWKVGEQLQCRRVLRIWRRRAVQHAATQAALRAAEREAEADRVARLSRLARTFYHWRTRGIVLRRYQIDRRRRLPLPLLPPQAQLQHSTKAQAPVVIMMDTYDSAEDKGMRDEALRTTSPSLVRAPSTSSPAPASSRSSQASKSVSARVSPRPTQRAAAAAKQRISAEENVFRKLRKSAERSPSRGRNKPAAAAAVPSEVDTEGHRQLRGDNAEGPPNKGITALAHAAGKAGKDTRLGKLVVHVPQSLLPPWRRTLALERQLFAVQRHTSLVTFGVCLPGESVEPRPSPTPSAASHSTATFANSAGKQALHFFGTQAPATSPPLPSRRATMPPQPFAFSAGGASSPPPRRHAARTHGDNDSSNDSAAASDVDRQMPIRSHTATPLFPRTRVHDSSPAARLQNSYFASDLVESPPQYTPQQLHSTREGVAVSDREDDASLYFTPRPSSHRLLSQMEQLLQRVRGIEADYRTPPAAHSRAA